ncbi:hypothetical protein C8F01DRAFT_557069 [Mycena amicta]|nr:hypothetical protein C8F01DRAFT_557069 [Mycena amicta]
MRSSPAAMRHLLPALWCCGPRHLPSQVRCKPSIRPLRMLTLSRTSLVALRRVQAARACWSACNFDVSAGIHPLLLCDVYDYRNTSYCSPPCVIQALHASNTAGLSYGMLFFS